MYPTTMPEEDRARFNQWFPAFARFRREANGPAGCAARPQLSSRKEQSELNLISFTEAYLRF